MRLTATEISLIKQQTAVVFGKTARVYLFGSRIDDTAKGGDIDLFIESDEQIDGAVAKSLQLNGALQLKLGMQKIDIIFSAPNYQRQAIHYVAKQQGVLL